MANLQVRDIDPVLYDSLKRLAKREHRSVSQEVIRIIEQHVNQPNRGANRGAKNMTREFLRLSGSWDDTRASEEIISDIYESRSSGQRFDNGIFD